MMPRELLTTTDIGAALGVTRRRAVTLSHRRDFPPPYAATPRGTRLWRRADVERFAAHWDRRPGRRREEAR